MPTLVQHASNTATFTSGTSGTCSATFGVNTTAGNCLVAAFSFFSGPSAKGYSVTVSSVDTNGTTENWAVAATSVVGAPVTNSWIYVDPNTGGGQKIINVTISFGTTAGSSNSAALLLNTYEVSNINTSATVDKTSTGGNNSGAASWSSGTTATTTVATEFWVGVVGLEVPNGGPQTVTGPGSPWTNESLLSSSVTQISTGDVYQLSGFQVTSSTGTATYSGTNSDSTSIYNAAVVTLKGATAVNVNLTTAQANIAAKTPGPVVSVPLTVAQVNISARSPGVSAGPMALTVAQVAVNARAPGLAAGPLSLPVAQVNINARALGVGPVSLSLPAAQVTINAHPFVIGKSFAITTAQVTVTAYPVGISRPGEQEDTIVPLMATGVYSNV